MGDTLSQEEIDNLLSALSTGEINPDELDEADVKSVRNYNFARPSKLSKDHLLLIDGNHRLHKARALGLENIPCYYLSQKQQQHFIVHFRPSEYEHIIACVS